MQRPRLGEGNALKCHTSSVSAWGPGSSANPLAPDIRRQAGTSTPGGAGRPVLPEEAFEKKRFFELETSSGGAARQVRGPLPL